MLIAGKDQNQGNPRQRSAHTSHLGNPQQGRAAPGGTAPPPHLLPPLHVGQLLTAPSPAAPLLLLSNVGLGARCRVGVRGEDWWGGGQIPVPPTPKFCRSVPSCSPQGTPAPLPPPHPHLWGVRDALRRSGGVGVGTAPCGAGGGTHLPHIQPWLCSAPRSHPRSDRWRTAGSRGNRR